MHISTAVLKTPSLAETRRFYENILGLKVTDSSDTAVSFAAGQSVLCFEQTATACAPYHFAFNIPANKLQEAMAWLVARTPLIPTDDESFVAVFDNWKAESVYFYDCHRNILEFIARFDLDNHADAPFSVDAILCISEMGLVADQPLELARQIADKTGLNYFAKSARREDFVAMGDDHGLFVISNPRRNWYPTGIRAESVPVRVEFNWKEESHSLAL